MSLSQFTKKVDKPSIDDRIMPLINIVFLLLIFFLVAGIIREADPMDIIPPESVVEDISPEDSINLYIDSNAQIALGQTITEKSDIPMRLTQLLKENPDRSVRIVADRSVETVEIVALMDIFRESGISKVSLATESLGSNP